VGILQRVGAVAVDDLQRGGQHGIAGDLAAVGGAGGRKRQAENVGFCR
jgi:hypothetical protein